jgi:hypothetical protein
MNEQEIIKKVKKITGNVSEKKIKRELKRLSKKHRGDDLVYAIAEKVS